MLDIIPHGDITELRLARPPVNALNLELLQTLHAAFDHAVAGGARGIVLSGQPGMFSAGVDVPTLLTLDHDGARGYWHEFFATAAALACSPVPLVAAVTGHSPAGGAVLALMCDHRVMADGAWKIGLNEVQVGLTVPDCIQLALRRAIGARPAERLLIAGTMLDAQQALACGYVDALAQPDDVIAHALQWMTDLLALPSRAMLATRRLARADLVATFADVEALPLDGFLTDYFAAETQTTLQALVARLKSKAPR
ncbi:MAG TPA: enoyl-CoA hydratase/isomerase family protein [Rhodanobacter sp.]|nr:enoyl-CoA hydratase/isomerase family protein [Rhodanobacter sp.]